MKSVRALQQLAVLLGSGLIAFAARAGDLDDFVSDLYGASGVTLNGNTDYQASSASNLRSLNSEFGLDLTYLSPARIYSGFTYDFGLGEVVRVDRSLGPLIGQDARTIGAQRFDLAFSYTRAEFKRLDGMDLDDFTLRFTGQDIDGPAGVPDAILGPAGSDFAFELDELELDLDIDFSADVFSIYATYGVTRRWDVELVVPIVHLRAKAKSTASIVSGCSSTSPACLARSNAIHSFASQEARRSKTGGDETGLGDILLRTKFQILRGFEIWPDMALSGTILLPTGDESDLLGTGEAAFGFLFIASKRFGWFTPHINVGYDVTTGDLDGDSLRYRAGFDARIVERLTVASDIVGRFLPGFSSSPRASISDGGHLVDLAVGARVRILRSLRFNANFQLPLNRDSGLRADLIWTLGFDYTFGTE